MRTIRAQYRAAASFDAAGKHLLAVTHGGERATVWSAGNRKQVAGAWTKLPLENVFFVGETLCAVHRGSVRADRYAVSFGSTVEGRSIRHCRRRRQARRAQLRDIARA